MMTSPLTRASAFSAAGDGGDDARAWNSGQARGRAEAGVDSPATINATVVHGTLRSNTPAMSKGDVMLLSWVDEATIPAAHRGYVRRHADRAASRHNLGRVRIRWFALATERAAMRVFQEAAIRAIRQLGVNIVDPLPPNDIFRDVFYFVAEADGDEPGGVTHPRMPMTIGLHADIRGPIVKAIVAHEVRHCAQIEARRLLGNVAAMEADANSFALEYLEYIGSGSDQ
jgi:hypothetical protein